MLDVSGQDWELIEMVADDRIGTEDGFRQPLCSIPSFNLGIPVVSLGNEGMNECTTKLWVISRLLANATREYIVQRFGGLCDRGIERSTEVISVSQLGCNFYMLLDILFYFFHDW